MKIFFSSVLLIAMISTRGLAATTVDDNDKYSWSPNLGWINWQGDVANGAAFGSRFASGNIYAANAGWISLGDGTPANRSSYANNSADDFGINIDAESDTRHYLLSGYAYGANIGWINFDFGDSVGAEYRPRIDKDTGILKGCAWSANAGWILFESPGISSVDTGLGRTAAEQWTEYR